MEKNSMSITLEGLSLHVTDLDRSMEFYARIPGAQLEAHRPGQFARFRIGEGVVHLVYIGTKTGFHIELNTSDLNETYQQLVSAGFEPSRPQTHAWGKTDFHLVDPDGYLLEFDDMDS